MKVYNYYVTYVIVDGISFNNHVCDNEDQAIAYMKDSLKIRRKSGDYKGGKAKETYYYEKDGCGSGRSFLVDGKIDTYIGYKKMSLVLGEEDTIVDNVHVEYEKSIPNDDKYTCNNKQEYNAKKMMRQSYIPDGIHCFNQIVEQVAKNTCNTKEEAEKKCKEWEKEGILRKVSGVYYEKIIMSNKEKEQKRLSLYKEMPDTFTKDIIYDTAEYEGMPTNGIIEWLNDRVRKGLLKRIDKNTYQKI